MDGSIQKELFERGSKGMKTRMTEQLYKTLKLTLEEIKVVSPISKETMRRIIRTDSYADYRALQDRYSQNTANNRLQKTEQAGLQNQISIDDLKPENDIAGLLKEHNELLRQLVSYVAVIVGEAV